MGMGIWNVRDGDKVKVHYTYSKQERPQREWSVRVGEIGLHMSTTQFNELLRQMLEAQQEHESAAQP